MRGGGQERGTPTHRHPSLTSQHPQVTNASPIDVPLLTSILQRASALVLPKDGAVQADVMFGFTLDRIARWLCHCLEPTRNPPPPEPVVTGLKALPLAHQPQHRHLLRGLVSATELYRTLDALNTGEEVVDRDFFFSVAMASPYLTKAQLAHILSHATSVSSPKSKSKSKSNGVSVGGIGDFNFSFSDKGDGVILGVGSGVEAGSGGVWPDQELSVVKFVYHLKKRAANIAEGFGGLAHSPQAAMIG